MAQFFDFSHNKLGSSSVKHKTATFMKKKKLRIYYTIKTSKLDQDCCV